MSTLHPLYTVASTTLPKIKYHENDYMLHEKNQTIPHPQPRSPRPLPKAVNKTQRLAKPLRAIRVFSLRMECAAMSRPDPDVTVRFRG